LALTEPLKKESKGAKGYLGFFFVDTFSKRHLIIVPHPKFMHTLLKTKGVCWDE